MATRHVLRLLGAVICAQVVPCAAQTVRRCPISADTIAEPCELDVWPDSVMQRRAPRYPAILRQAGVGGRVHLSYVIDTTGRVVRSSVAVMASTHDLFTQAVRVSVGEQRFGAPRRVGVRVPVRVEEVITFFAVPDRNTQPASWVKFLVDTAGHLATIVAAPGQSAASVLFDSTKAQRLTAADDSVIYVAVVDALLRQHEGSPPPSAFCVQLNRLSPNVEFVARWQRPERRVVPAASCPPTYTSMIRRLNDARPKGYVDPIEISILRPRGWAKDVVVLEATVGQGTETRYYRCEVSRDGTSWGHAICAHTRSILS
jgi:TonB family protein